MKEKYPMILLTWNLKERYKQALALVSWLNKEIYWKSLYPLLLNLKNEVSVVARINKITYQEKKKRIRNQDALLSPNLHNSSLQ